MVLLSRSSFNQDCQKQSAKDLARQRWKILCLVKTSDTVADETARQENLKERVDEWMSSMISKMSMAEDTTKDNVVNGDTNVGLNNSGRSSPDPDSIGKGNRNVFCNHQIALRSIF